MIRSWFKIAIFLISGFVVAMQHNQQFRDALQNFPTDRTSLKTHIEARGIQLPHRSFERHARFLWRCIENNIFVQRALGQGYVLYRDTSANRSAVHLVPATGRRFLVIESSGFDQTELQECINTVIKFEEIGY